MKGNSEQKAADMECVERRRFQPHGLKINSRREKVDGIPDTPLFENPVETCEDGHRDTTGQAALNAGRDGIRFEWKQSPGKIRCEVQPCHLWALSRDRSVFLNHGHLDVFFVWQNIAEPSHASNDHQYRPQQTDGSAGYKTGEQQRDPKSENDRPSRRRG